MASHKPLVLVILDGFGVSLDKEGNPVFAARASVLQELEQFFPFTVLQASGVAVGLPWGVAGNSEVGHLTIGAGRVIYHHLPRIINAIYDKSFFANEAFKKAAAHAHEHGSRLHIAGLISSGSVHSYIDHLYALLEFTKQERINSVLLHIFSDGKDASPQEGAKFFSLLEERIQKDHPHVAIASVMGRSYAMDRDEQWGKTEIAYNLLTQGTGTPAPSASEHLAAAYKAGTTDDGIEPAIIGNPDTSGRIMENDALIFLNFREDSMRQLTHAFADESYEHFARTKVPNLLIVTMTEYEKNLLGTLPAFPQLDIAWPLARVLSEANLTHLHIAETQKYAHVTYFFNGGAETPFAGEKRTLIQSIQTPHFDEVPEMKAEEITAHILEELSTQDVIIANFANTDLVGHSGNFKAAIKAIEIVDASLGKIKNAVLNQDGVLIVTADHGNIELKRDMLTGEKRTKHSINPVPFFLIANDLRRTETRTEEEIRTHKTEVGGILTDIAPTIIELLGLKKPTEMTGKSLLDELTQS